jgi:hypothetical protein
MGKFYVYTSRPSKGARALAKVLGGQRVKSFANFSPSFLVQQGGTIINWGDSQCPANQVLNQSSAIRTVANKATAFDAFSSANVPIPAYAKAKADVGWEGLTVVRHKLTGHSGEGIELCDASELPDAPLYVKYIPKEQEYRIHVGTSRVAGTEPVLRIIAVQRKARRHEVPDSQVNWKVRNHSNGFVFARQGVNAPQNVLDAARAALTASGLDFGAVDVILTKQGKAYVLEINTAPGLEGTTVTDYANFFRGDTQ